MIEDNSGLSPALLVPDHSMLHLRILFSAVAIPAVFGLFWLDHRIGETAPILLALALLIATGGCIELVALLRPRFGVRLPVPLIGTLGVVSAGWLYPFLDPKCCPLQAAGLVGAAFAIAVVVAFACAIRRYEQPGANLERLAAEIFVIAYVGVLLAITAQLRWIVGHERGYLVLGSLVVCVKLGDIGAYTLGRLFGKRKLVPKLSPGKTRAGGVGALLFSGAAGYLWLTFGPPVFTTLDDVPAWYWAVGYGVLIGAVGLLGDLCESLIKRDTDTKDSSAVIPGFGGVLDLVDSILYAGPVAWLCWLGVRMMS